MNLESISYKLREDVVAMLLEAGSGHTAGPLGMADVFAVLFFGGVLKFDPDNPSWEERDRLVLSNGHICPILYASMAQAGYFPHEELSTLRDFGTRLQGHPHRESLPGLETSSGPLGSGLSQAAGMALVGKREGKEWFAYCLGSDGEHDEGNWWEAVIFAAKYQLGNLISIVDRNGIQIDGYTKDVMPLESLTKKYRSFNWHVQEIDGHNHFDISQAIEVAKSVTDSPSVIIANTVPGKGVEFMENLPEWHGKPPNVGQTIEALHELRTLEGRVEPEYH